MKKFSILVGIFMVMVFLVAEIFAQTKQEDAYKRFQMMRIWRLTDELNLTEEQAAKVLPIIKKYDKERRNLLQERNKLIKEFQDKIKKDQIAEKDNSQLLSSWEEIEIKRIKIDKQEFKELSSVLNKGQQAKYLLFKMRFPREMRRLFKQRRQRKSPLEK